MRIALDQYYIEHTGNRFVDHELTLFDRRTVSPDTLVDEWHDAEVVGMARAPAFIVGREIIERLPNLQFIQKSGSGADHFDVEVMTEHGIVLALNTGFNASPVAEHAITLILLTLRNTIWYVEALRKGQWVQEEPPGGIMSLRGKTIGIVGLGESGSFVARAMLGMGAQVIAFQRSRRPEIEHLADITWASSLDELLEVSDAVTLHVPHTRDTDKLIGRRELALMKPTSVLINCSRGRVVDEAALIDAIESGKIRAAGLDVFEDEPTSMDNPLLHNERVIATPHVAGGTVESRTLQIEGTLSNLERFARGEMPLRIVNPEVLSSPALRATHLRQ